MEVIPEAMERLRSNVGPESWDYCVLWKPCKDQRVIECIGCCCSGSNSRRMNGNGVEHDQQVLFQCKDVAFYHPTTDACHLLSLLPSSIPFDSGIYGQTMISNQPRWLNFSNSSDSNFSEENLGTKVLIPISYGLVELFVSKQIAEDQSIINFVTDVFNKSLEQLSMSNINNNVASNFSINMDGSEDGESKEYITQVLEDQKEPCNNFQPPVSPATILENLNISPHNISDNRLHPMNFLQHFNYVENQNVKNIFLEGTSEPMIMNNDDPFDPSLEENVGFDHEIDMALQGQMLSDKGHLMENNVSKKQGNDMNINRSDSVSDCSDQNDEDDDPKCRRRNGKPQSKNLMAERKRRKKLNDRLYTLRSLVPKITKLDRASILKDAIEYVMELKRQVEDLQNELEENSDDEDTTINDSTIVEQEVMHGNGCKSKRRYNHGNVHGMFINGPPLEAYSGIGVNEVSKHNTDIDGGNEKSQQMEPQVEVASLDGNEFFVKVFREHKPGGFVSLMEAFNSLGLEVTNVNVTSFRCLVLNVFKVEKKDSEMIQADQVRESLLEITRNPSKTWTDTSKVTENDHGMLDHHQHNSHLHNNQLKPPQYHYNAMYQVFN